MPWKIDHHDALLAVQHLSRRDHFRPLLYSR
jgi:hypothetical protein